MFYIVSQGSITLLCCSWAGCPAQRGEGGLEQRGTGVSAGGSVGVCARLHSALPAAAHSLQPTEWGGEVACCLQMCLFF